MAANMATINIEDGRQNGCWMETSPIIAHCSKSEQKSGTWSKPDGVLFVHQIVQECISNSCEHRKSPLICNYKTVKDHMEPTRALAKNDLQFYQRERGEVDKS